MESLKVLAIFAMLAVCVAAIPADLPTAKESNVAAVAPPTEAIREKKQALYYPTTYSSAYPYYGHYPYAYSYQHYDDGKYWPGKYDKLSLPYYRYSYPASAYYNPYYLNYPYYY